MQKMYPEQSLASLCTLLCAQSGGSVETTAHGATRYATPASGFYSRHMVTGLAPDAMQAQLEEIQQAATGPLPSLVSFTKGETAPKARALLPQLGFVPMAMQAGMVFTMAGHTLPAQPRPGSEAVELVQPGNITEWSAANTEAFGKPDETAACKALVHNKECQFYAVRDGGKIVATTLLHLAPENAGIHEVGTLKDHRRRGLCRLLMQCALDEVKRRGIPYVSLQASEAGKAVYDSLGFETVSTIETWMYMPQA